jgi:Zn-dependent protease
MRARHCSRSVDFVVEEIIRGLDAHSVPQCPSGRGGGTAAAAHICMNRRLHLGRIFGVEVSVDWSWILTFVLATWTLVSLNRRLLLDLDTPLVALSSAAVAAGLFASLGAHELARVHAARACGVPVRRLTLFVLGGVTNVERSPASPRTEAIGALAAPAASLVVALVLACGVAVASAPLPRGLDDLDRLGAPGVVLLEIAAANLVVAAVNLLPAYPLDGGRILRAAIWKITGDVDRATRLSAWAGQVIGWTLVLLGIGITLGSWRGPVVGLGMWTCFVGWFVASAAAQGYEGVIAQRPTT